MNFKSANPLYNKLAHKIETHKIRHKYTTKAFTPQLTASSKDTVRCFDAAIHNAIDINTVPCIYGIYNSTGLLQHPFMLRAGKNYSTPWTRDAAINTWQAMRFLNPQVARTTLLAVCTANKKGEPIIQPDVQTWDQIVWTVGSWNYYLATGDEEFLRIAHGIIGRALEYHRKNRFNADFGLFRGGSFFNDGIAGYPIECHEADSKASFAPAHPVVERIMCLSTNCLFCEAYRIYGEICEHFGYDVEASAAREHHKKLKSTVNNIFFDESSSRYRYILYPDGHTDSSQETSGTAFAVLFDICPVEKQKTVLENLIISERGLVSIWPPFKGLFSDSKPGRHNNVIWPFLNGIIIQAAAKCELDTLVGGELDRITELFKNSGFELYEIYSPYTGKAYGGWQTGREWDSCHHQTWSATCYLGAFIHGIFGISIQKDSIGFSPCVPEELKDCELNNLAVHGMTLAVKIHGFGTEIERFELDGKESEPFVKWDENGHKVQIWMK